MSKKRETDGFEEFKKEYDAAETIRTEEDYVGSEYSLSQQLERFRNFSNEEDWF